MVILYLVFWGTSILFSIVTIPIYIPTKSIGGETSVFNSHPLYQTSILMQEGWRDIFRSSSEFILEICPPPPLLSPRSFLHPPPPPAKYLPKLLSLSYSILHQWSSPLSFHFWMVLTWEFISPLIGKRSRRESSRRFLLQNHSRYLTSQITLAKQKVQAAKHLYSTRLKKIECSQARFILLYYILFLFSDYKSNISSL